MIKGLRDDHTITSIAIPTLLYYIITFKKRKSLPPPTVLHRHCHKYIACGHFAPFLHCFLCLSLSLSLSLSLIKHQNYPACFFCFYLFAELMSYQVDSTTQINLRVILEVALLSFIYFFNNNVVFKISI